MRRDLTPFELWIKQRLLLRNMTQKELAKKVGTTSIYLCKISKGEKKNSKYTERIIEILATGKDDVMEVERILEERLLQSV